MLEVNDFNAIRVSLASPEQIKGWSYGEVTKPETINYRTLKPEKDGLFCERIFGPTKDFECYCGKYKRVRYKGIVCDKCGVEVARSKVRRERMGHVELAAPVSHIWFVKGTPSRIGLLLDLSPRSLERVLYFAQFMVTEVHKEARQQTVARLHQEAEQELSRRQQALEEKLAQINAKLEQSIEDGDDGLEQARLLAEQEIGQLHRQSAEEKARLEEDLANRIGEMEEIRPLTLLTETKYAELHSQYGDTFSAGMGAEAVLDGLMKLDLVALRDSLFEEVRSTSGQRRKKAIKRLRVVEALRRSGNKPEWMILTVLPVLPPELRPMVQLDGGRFATSDLNDLYRRVINRNNRLRRLLELGAPDIIIRNEKRMLQEAVDSLIDNGRRGRAVSSAGNHRLKSLSDMLRGKQGRFRQNLLGKRVDYSGRSVIVVGPELKLHQCGLPKRMALELFKPFVMNKLVARGLAHNIKSAKRIVERGRPEVWDVLEDVISERPVLLNRAPTLHRLGIQAFEPVLIDGSAIQIHPLVCAAFNADFDGDQMAVHLPLSRAAVAEARQVMLSVHNMLLPSSGEPVAAPTLDMVLGCYYMTNIKPGAKGEGTRFGSFQEAVLAYDLGLVDIQAKIEVRDEKTKGQSIDTSDGPSTGKAADQSDEKTRHQRIETSVGRILFNEVLPAEMGFQNQTMDKGSLKRIVADSVKILGVEECAEVVDNIKALGFRYATKSGTTIAISDIEVPPEKPALLQEADDKIAEVDNQYRRGLITDEERYTSAVEIWNETTGKIQEAISRGLHRYGGVYMMATSGAKGNIAQIRQMAGMRGLMTDPSGRIIDFPIRSSFREGLTVLEYFISTHGARKGLADTALRTADSGYLTRRLVDVAQDVVVSEEDCGTTSGIWVAEPEEKGLASSLTERIVGRMAAAKVVHPASGELIADRNQEIDEDRAAQIVQSGITQVYVRSPLSCQSHRGVCRHCYGRNLGHGTLVQLREAVGIVAAQSIGEPGTQLTMRTFHTGGVAGIDITSGLPRLEELFEARTPRGQAIISEINGRAAIEETEEGRRIRVVSSDIYNDVYPVPQGYQINVNSGEVVDVGTVLALPPRATAPSEETAVVLPPVSARVSGRVEVGEGQVVLHYEERDEREYVVPASARIRVENGAKVNVGDQLTDGSINPQDILGIRGREAVQRALVDEIQKVYRSQGVNINDKHIEVIVRQMLRRVMVDSPGDTDMLPGELVDRFVYEDINAKVLAEGGEPATAQTVLLGVTKASLNTESFLAAASFQETTRVLTEAATAGKIDRLQGLKENVIIGKLISAHASIIVEEPKQLLPLELLPGPQIPEAEAEPAS